MTSKKTNPPAFPKAALDPWGKTVVLDEGMSLRDYVAIHAIQGMLSHPTRYRPRKGASENWHEAISEEALEIADAYLLERQK